MAFRNLPDAKHEKDGITYYDRDDVTVEGKSYKRIAIQTHFVERGESYTELVKKYVAPLCKEGDLLSISEKIISMCQNHVVEMKDVKVGFWARFLSKFASSNNRGVAMDEPYKLQLAINLAGLPRILLAAICGAICKLFCIRGVFYKIAGHGIAGIDGFYKRSSFELYRTLALLGPQEPDRVCREIKEVLGIDCMLVDANDINVEILGKSPDIPYTDATLKAIIKDNPAGQSDELTPFILITPQEN